MKNGNSPEAVLQWVICWLIGHDWMIIAQRPDELQKYRCTRCRTDVWDN